MRRLHYLGSRLCSILLAFILVLGLFPAIQPQKVSAAEIDPIYEVVLNGNDIKADNVNGLTFKGFGAVSANSTSALLMDYKSEQPEVYAEMLQRLFGGKNPLMGHVKIEMGNDRNNSTGPDPATMRTEDEEANVTRHPGFQLAADAKAINPGLKVSLLRWNAPAWANNNDKIYTWYKKTILAAYREYGYMVDYVNPGLNEHAPELEWTKQYANRVKSDCYKFASPEEQALYNQIQVVISDEVGIGSFGGSMVSDESLRKAAPIAAYHYNTNDDSAGNFKRLAEQYDIEIWNSEAQATFGNSSFRPNNNTKDPTVAGTGIGGSGSALEIGNTIIKGFVNSRRTHFIYQPAIGSFYEGAQYSFKELLSARDPWSGWIHYDAGLAILQHFSWFATSGWENENNTEGIWRAVPQASHTGATGTNPVNGRNGKPSYMTLAAPDKSDFSTVFVNDSEYERTYKLQTDNMGYTGTPELEAWETRAADEGEAFNSNYMQYRGQIVADGSDTYTIKVKPFSIVTVSTLENKDNPDYHAPLPVEGKRTVLDTDSTGNVQNTEDNVLYADNFDYQDKEVPVIGADGKITGRQSYIQSRGGEKGTIPRYTHDRNGAFEAYLDEQTNNYVLRQQLDRSIMGLGGTWNDGDPVTAIGDNRWTNYKASVDVSFENNSMQDGANYAAIGARYQGGGSSHSISGTPYVLKFWFDGNWQLLVNNSNIASGNVATGTGGVKITDFKAEYDAWHKLAIEVAGDKITAYIDGVEVASYTDPNPKLSGRVDLASGYYHVRFDNLLVETIDGFTPYYTELLDDLEMHDLAPQPETKLIYNELWNHTNGQGMYHYQRSLSTNQDAGATLEYTFTGTGLDILGPNNGTAKLEVMVDGQIVMPSANTIASKELYQAFALRGLEYGKHTVQIKVLSGTLTIDAVAVVGGNGGSRNSGGNAGGDSSHVISTNGTITIPVGKSGEVSLDGEIAIKIPIGAADQELRITIEKQLETSNLLTDQETMVSHVFEVLKNFSDNFKRPVTLTLKFDPNKVEETQKVALFYYDEEKKTWIEVGGTVDGQWITAEIDHFTKFAVMVVEEKPEITFSDITGHWAEEFILEGARLGMIKGYIDGTFRPNEQLTRAQAVSLLVRALDLQTDEVAPFKDITGYAAETQAEIAAAYKYGLVIGQAGNFMPSKKVSRSQMALMLHRAYEQKTGVKYVAKEIAPYPDFGNYDEETVNAISMLYEMGIATGSNGKYMPANPTTRAHAAKMLVNFFSQDYL